MQGEFRWRGYAMGGVRVDSHIQIHLWTPTNDRSLCEKMLWSRDAVDKDVATGWPDCGGCVNEAFRRIVSA